METADAGRDGSGMTVKILTGDCRDILPTLPERSVQCVVTSPPYWGLRDYGVAGQIGLEPTLDEYVDTIVAVFQEVKRVLRDDGTLWLNMGDAYNAGTTSKRQPTHTGKHGYWENPAIDQRVNAPGLKTKDLIGMPWLIAFALRADGWYLRSDIIWNKPNPMPESVRDRPTSAHEHIFLLTKRPRYYYDADAVRTPAKSETTKMPDGWDTGPGAHGSIHRNGREKGERVDKQRGHGRRHDGFNDRWDAMSKDEQQAGGANLRNVWTIATHAFAEAHFATFPPSLAETCIKAGTSEKGCCSSCGAPWMRVVEKGLSGTDDRRPDRGVPGRTGLGHSRMRAGDPVSETTGWASSCTCGADVVPCKVLDIFGGSGTTGMVADRLGRDAILIELNPEYIEIGQRRIVGDSPMFANVEVA